MGLHLTPVSNRIASTYTVSSHIVTELPAQAHYIAATNFSDVCDMHYIYTTCYSLIYNLYTSVWLTISVQVHVEGTSWHLTLYKYPGDQINKN
jgi:hypothetical protein